MDAATFLRHIAFGAAIFALSAGATWFMARVVRLMDVPSARSSHSAPTPKSGGLAIVLAFLVGSLAIYFLARYARIEDRHYWGFLLCGVLLALISFVDDVTQKSFVAKLATQLLCMLVMLGTGVVISRLWIPFSGEVALPWAGYALTALWLVGLTNAYNFMDGLDGLAGGVALITALFLCGIALHERSWFVYLTSWALIGAVGGFLVFNFPVARIFMGDVGSAFLGFSFAALAVIGSQFDLGHMSFYVVPLLLFHFIFDTFLTFLRRLVRGEPVHLAHRTHLYQLLNRTGFSHVQVSAYHYAVSVAQGVGALVLVNLHSSQRVYVFVPFLAYQALYAWWVLRRARAAGILEPKPR